MSLSHEDYRAAQEVMRSAIQKMKDDGLFDPVQIVVVDDDGSETDLCDISQPLERLLEEAGR